MKIMEYCTIAIILLIGLYSVGVIRSASIYLREKTNKLKMEKNEVESSLDVDFSNKVLSALIDIIKTEVLNKLKQNENLKIIYDVRNIDDDIKTISETVFNSLKPSVYNNNKRFVYSPEYLLKFITENTSLILLTEIANLNDLYKI